MKSKISKAFVKEKENLRTNIYKASVSPYKDIPMKNNNAPVYLGTW